MKAVVVYESLWGNTAAVAQAVAEGIGEGAVALPTKDAGADELAGADLIVAGGPVFAFHLSSERTRHDIAEHPEPGPRSRPERPPDPRVAGRAASRHRRVRLLRHRGPRSLRQGRAHHREGARGEGLPECGQAGRVHRAGQVRPVEGRRTRPGPTVGRVPAGSPGPRRVRRCSPGGPVSHGVRSGRADWRP